MIQQIIQSFAEELENLTQNPTLYGNLFNNNPLQIIDYQNQIITLNFNTPQLYLLYPDGNTTLTSTKRHKKTACYDTLEVIQNLTLIAYDNCLNNLEIADLTIQHIEDIQKIIKRNANIKIHKIQPQQIIIQPQQILQNFKNNKIINNTAILTINLQFLYPTDHCNESTFIHQSPICQNYSPTYLKYKQQNNKIKKTIAYRYNPYIYYYQP